jgi:hypothetical protein
MKVDHLLVKDRFGNESIVNSEVGELGCEVFWEFNGNKITKSVINMEKSILIPCLSPSHEEIIIVSSSLKGIDPSISAVIFNPDGTVRFYLRPPVLVSGKFKEYEKKVGKEVAFKSIEFIQPEIKKVNEKEIVAMWIGFGYDWFEIRELNLQTGEFGECYGASRL